MLQGNKKLFLNRELLYNTLVLRKNGWSFTSLSLLTGADRTSVRSQARKFVVFPITQVYNPERIAVTVIQKIQPKDKYKTIKNEKINLGKSYSEYKKANIPIEKKRIYHILGI
jgi:hypothetical protein